MKKIRSLTWITCAFLAGILAGEHLSVGVFPLVTGIAVLQLLAAFLWRKPGWWLVLVVVVFALLGVLRMRAANTLEQNHVADIVKFYRKKPIRLEGLVVSDVGQRSFYSRQKTVFELSLLRQEAPWGWEECRGKILVNVFGPADVFYGDKVRIEGKIHRPFDFSKDENLSYRNYLAQRDIFFILSVGKNGSFEIIGQAQAQAGKRKLFVWRNRLKALLDNYFHPSESSIMKAVLLGDRSGIPEPINRLFSNTGTAHVLAISGLNMGVVTAIFLLITKLMPVPHILRLMITVLLVTGYTILTGGQPSVVRASLMAIVLLGSFYIERETDSMNSLSLAALIILVYNPKIIFDIGFQLSFMCVLSIILFYPFFLSGMRIIGEKSMISHRLWESSAQALALSLSAWLGAAGLILYYFGMITPVALAANFFVVPLTGAIVVLGFIFLMGAAVFPYAGYLLSLCIKFLLNLMIGIIFIMDKIPAAYFSFQRVSLWPVFLYYVVLGSLVPFARLLFKFKTSRPQSSALPD